MDIHVIRVVKLNVETKRSAVLMIIIHTEGASSDLKVSVRSRSATETSRFQQQPQYRITELQSPEIHSTQRLIDNILQGCGPTGHFHDDIVCWPYTTPVILGLNHLLRLYAIR